MNKTEQLKHNLLGNAKTKGYRPSTLIFPQWMYSGQAVFTLTDVESMRRDYQVNLGLNMLKSPLYTAQWSIKCPQNPMIAKYVNEQLFRLWRASLRKILRALEYGYAAGEILYKLDHRDLVVFAGYKDFHPRDIRVLTDEYQYAGIRIKNIPDKGDVDIFAPKAFFFSTNREFQGWYGRSWLISCWEDYTEKRSRDGAIDIRRLWFYKNAYTGGIIRHPNKDYVMPDGTIISARDMAKEMGERLKTGSPIAFSSTRGTQGQFIWSYESPGINGNATEIREYPKDLDVGIFRGLNIPDNVINEAAGTGSYAGRRVPERAFYVILEMLYAEIMEAIKIQILEPLVKINFEGNYEFFIETKPLVEVASPEGTPPAGTNSPFEDDENVGGMFVGGQEEETISSPGNGETGGNAGRLSLGVDKKVKAKRRYVQTI
jgi:hypothetical protein